MSKITIEIWSDVMCPFCYIGKRQLERALREFPQGEAVEVIWKSFQLQPNLQTDPSKSVLQSLAESKGWSREQTLSAMAHVTEMAAAEGLHYDFERAVVANSFDAHRLTHLAKAHGLQNAVEEGLFAAYFCEGKNTADAEVLRSIGLSAGLPPDAVDA
ncbi:MAG TPA: DsbA family oxidoreductase, partial [Saprospiraceae bacterium]|nr:DsbA family oxidoreductase [Saprospiraceae bacterium]